MAATRGLAAPGELTQRLFALTFIVSAARENRAEITAIVQRHGFVAYPWEFWHYNSGDVYESILGSPGRPARYGAIDVNLDTGAITPIDEPGTPLNTTAEIERAIEQALDRRSAG